MNVVDIIISCMIMNFIDIIVIGKIFNRKNKLISFKFLSTYVIMIILVVSTYIFIPNYLKAVFIFFIMTLVSYILFKESIKRSLLSALILEIVTIIAEIVFSIFISVFSNLHANDVAETFQGTILANLFISINIFLISIIINLHSIYNKIINITAYISIRKVILLFCFIIWCFNLIFYFSFYNDNNYITIIFNILLSSVYLIIVLSLIRKDNKYNRIYLKYMKSLENLEEYESIINEYRIINHENKNQLLCIKGMTKNKKVNDYLDEFINGKNNDSEFLIKQALLIPIGGLRGLIYSKLITIKNKNLQYQLNIDKKINNKLFSNIESKDLIDICQIIGVYIDNAIEANETIDKSMLIINIFLDKDIYFEVINNIIQIVDISKLGSKRYTTKSHNHGYGLMLVNKVLRENSNLSSTTIVTDKMFKQQLRFKIK